MDRRITDVKRGAAPRVRDERPHRSALGSRRQQWAGDVSQAYVSSPQPKYFDGALPAIVARFARPRDGRSSEVFATRFRRNAEPLDKAVAAAYKVLPLRADGRQTIGGRTVERGRTRL